MSDQFDLSDDAAEFLDGGTPIPENAVQFTGVKSAMRTLRDRYPLLDRAMDEATPVEEIGRKGAVLTPERVENQLDFYDVALGTFLTSQTSMSAEDIGGLDMTGKIEALSERVGEIDLSAVNEYLSDKFGFQQRDIAGLALEEKVAFFQIGARHDGVENTQDVGVKANAVDQSVAAETDSTVTETTPERPENTTDVASGGIPQVSGFAEPTADQKAAWEARGLSSPAVTEPQEGSVYTDTLTEDTIEALQSYDSSAGIFEQLRSAAMITSVISRSLSTSPHKTEIKSEVVTSPDAGEFLDVEDAGLESETYTAPNAGEFLDEPSGGGIELKSETFTSPDADDFLGARSGGGTSTFASGMDAGVNLTESFAAMAQGQVAGGMVAGPGYDAKEEYDALHGSKPVVPSF